MKPLLVLLILLCGPIWISHLPEVDARKKLPLSPAPVPSLEAPPSFPVLSSMAAFSPGSPAGEHHKMDTNKILIIVLIAASIVVGAITLSLLYFWIWHRKTSPKSHQKQDFTSVGKYNYKKMSFKNGGACLMDYKLLETATKNFQESNILGQGGFGCIYKARLDDNFHVAVKRLSGGSQDAITEFETEVDLLSQMQHPNIISLLGYSIHGETRLLVYELMDNGSLETQLYGPSRGSDLNWHRRMKIALDMARGLEYLHEHCNPLVIHRDLKSSNILLDSNFNAKLSDFGLAITDGSQNKKNIKLSGTLGYVAPEYLLDGKLTDKSDVYAFGVVLLELILGRKPVEKVSEAQCQSIVTWVAAVAVLCVQPEPSYRPFITDVLHSLIPLVPIELGGTLRSALQTPTETPSGHR